MQKCKTKFNKTFLEKNAKYAKINLQNLQDQRIENQYAECGQRRGDHRVSSKACVPKQCQSSFLFRMLGFRMASAQSLAAGLRQPTWTVTVTA